MKERSKYQQSLSEFIGRFAWTHHVTLTWDPARLHGDPSLATVVKLARTAMCALARSAAGANWYRKTPPTIEYIGVVERTKFGRLHVHLAVRLVPVLTPKTRRKFDGVWKRLAGISRIDDVFDGSGLADYLTKAAGPNAEFFISPK
jgi:hypothetical protein